MVCITPKTFEMTGRHLSTDEWRRFLAAIQRANFPKPHGTSGVSSVSAEVLTPKDHTK